MEVLSTCLSLLVSLSMITRIVVCGTDDDNSSNEVTLRKLFDLTDKRMENMERKLIDIHKQTENLDTKLNDVHEKIEALDWKINITHNTAVNVDIEMYSMFDSIQNETESMNRKVSNLHRKMQNVNRHLNNVNKKTKNVYRKLNFVVQKTEDMDRKLDHVSNMTYDSGRKLDHLSNMTYDTGKKLYHVSNTTYDTQRKRSSIHRQTQDADSKINDMYETTKRMDSQLNHVHQKTDDIVRKLYYVFNITEDMEEKLSFVHTNMRDVDNKVNHVWKNTEDMNSQVNITQAATEDMVGSLNDDKNMNMKLDDLYELIHNKTENMSRKLCFLISIIGEDGYANDVNNQINTSPCSFSKVKNKVLRKLDTIIQSLGIAGTEKKLVCKSHTGNEYILMFPYLYADTSKLQILITSLKDAIVYIESPYPGVNQTVQVKATQGRVVSIPNDFMIWVYGGGRSSKGILVRSDVQISVYGVIQYEAGQGEAFMAIPTRFLSTTYNADAFGHDRFATVALNDDTLVNYTKKAGSRFEETSQIQLSSLSTYSIKSSVPITLSSSKVIGVISKSSCLSTFCEQNILNILPLHSLGNAFIVPHVRRWNYSYIHIGSFWNLQCNLTIQGVLYNETTNFTRNREYSLSSKIPYAVETSLPSNLVLYTPYYHPSPVNSKVLVPAISQYSNHYKFLTPFTENYDHYIIIMIEAKDVSSLMFDTRPVSSMPSDTQPISFKDTLYNVISLNITAGLHEVYHVDSDVTFGLLALGFNPDDAYGFPVGLYLGKESCTDL